MVFHLTGATPGRTNRFFTLAHHADADPPRSDPDAVFALPRSRREAVAREAILAAARGARIDEGDIRNILTETVDRRGLSVTDIMVRAASMAEQYAGRQAFNWRSATPDQIARYLASLGLEPGWRRALREAGILGATRTGDDGDDGISGSSLRFVEMDISRITSSNYNSTDFHRCGIDYGTFSELRSQGFSGQNILNAARDAERLGFRGDRNAIRDHALIDRHSIDARGMNAALLDYRRRLHGDTELRTLMEQRRGATTDEERMRLDELIAARRLEHERGSGLRERIHNPTEDARAREAAEGRRRAINREQNELFGLDPGVGAGLSDATLQSQVIAPATTRQDIAVVAGQATRDVAPERPNADVAASLVALRP
jgi:hypothetical protein